MSTIEELGSFLAREKNAASTSNSLRPTAVPAPGEVTHAA